MTGRHAMTGEKPVLLSGGNPQIAKGYGDGPVKAYMPGWKREIGRRLAGWIAQASRLPGERM